MRVLFIRHADAADADVFVGSDLDRPLTGKGKRLMKAAASALAARGNPIDVVYTSEARRSRETAAIVARAFDSGKPVADARLNPGALPAAFRKVLAAVPARACRIAIVGHEPDLSRVVSALVSSGRLDLKLKKGACAEVELDEGRRGKLRMLIDPELLAARR